MDQPNIFQLDVKKPKLRPTFDLDIAEPTPEPKDTPSSGPSVSGSGPLADKADARRRLRDWIGDIESNGDYDKLNGGGKLRGKQPTEMTIREVMREQLSWRNWPNSASSAIGKYQFVRDSLNDRKRQINADVTELFDQSMQDRLCNKSLELRGFNRWWNNTMTDRTFLYHLAGEWASLPDPATDRSRHGNVANNKSLIGTQECLAFLRSLKGG